MDGASLLSEWSHLVLVWVGFGTLVGLLAKAVLPGRDPGGALATVLIGIVGSILGAGALLFFSDNLRVSPISPLGFVVAIAGTSILLLLNRILGGYPMGLSWPLGRARRARRRVSVAQPK